MADVNKPKLQLRSGISINGDKTPSPATKLLINHGKPNFTIQRSPKAQNGNNNPLSPTPKPISSDEFVVKSTKFNGVFKPSNISAATKEVLKQNGSGATNGNDNEAAKVVLRRTKVVQPELRDGEDENVPEFILRQRRIQERLANQNIMDFESRRSGYFTQVMISPSSPNRQSFVETMASPAVKPGLEMPPPAEQEENNNEESKNEPEITRSAETLNAEPVTLNGQIEEEEVAKAIEEVNKAVEGEDDDKTEEEQLVHIPEQTEHTVEPAVDTVSASEQEIKEEEKPQVEKPAAEVLTEVTIEEAPVATVAGTSAVEVTEEKICQHNGEAKENDEVPEANGTVEEHEQNGHSNGKVAESEVTISHSNGLNGPSLPSSDPTGEKGINFEPKTVVSFSQELGNDVNKYPDTVKVVKEGETSEVDSELKELTKLKFEINANDKDIEVKPVLITETVTN
ncbi:hypothetical protein DOY81_001976 [Sarcophaga bullata]|nr:hypothetical protein DOY81_001976 [Sarcophaga bullata]